ncbi:MAG: Holliday junction resolvase RuvX [Vicinamibacterales bacterium]|jgi:putative Holliday junction resolvase|nr:Holliday junction resolvase RuvX [Acidobacteriota bacterium]MDP6370973.1 Holliday junction resolvase RuvX [Vicinamibacterales bacterium]MDP6607617.1 Holliday junction resolvase RuvX [Vicinamibacterales bacterium]HAK55373.1 Holliday junction resolvase RuvX [Acidobacteriota bacterium]|tara:strand:- start:7 stop:435 length:429 start_codon:yes stop_codon:yes gene_type:complete
MRLVGLDVGDRRVGLAVSDASGTLARPLRTITRHGAIADVVTAVVDEIRKLRTDDDGLDGIVVGLPRHLDGRSSQQTTRVQAFADRLRRQVDLPLAFQDERLSSHEAERLLAKREPDWRRRKASLDAAAAAVILQDHLDQTP